MHLGITSDQELFQATTKKFIEAACPVSGLRALARTADGYDADYWRRGAELGWTSLLVGEAAGGGAVSDSGLADLTLVAFEFGRHASPGPLGPANVVAGSLGRPDASPAPSEALAAIMAGQTVGAWAGSELSGRAITARPDGRDYILDGLATPVEAGAQAACFLVTARADVGATQFLVPEGAPGLTVVPLEGLDLTRRWARVELSGLRAPSSWLLGEPGRAGPDVERQLGVAVCIQLAETVGAMQAAFDMTADWAANRYSFGRPLNSYQEIKHRFADMRTWLEASYAITSAATGSVHAGRPDAPELVSAAKAYVGQYGPELVQDCVQMHGGIGVTFDHDLHLFLRRVSAGAALYGSPRDHRLRLGRMVAARRPAGSAGRGNGEGA